jgi:hypothetical protein
MWERGAFAEANSVARNYAIAAVESLSDLSEGGATALLRSIASYIVTREA